MPTLLRADSPGGTYTPADPSLATAYNAAFDGVTLNGVARVETPDPSDPRYAFFCSGTRIGPRTVLTAAHCVTDDNSGALLSTVNETVVRFRGPAAGGGSRYYSFTAFNVAVEPTWRGFANPGTLLYQDVAVLNFAAPLPPWVTTYSIFNDGALGSQTPAGRRTVNVGYGTFGNGIGPEGFDGRRRVGGSTVDFVANDPTSNDFGDLYTTFQDASGHYDTTCEILGICNPSRGNVEANTAEGDSGGPLLIDGQLAGVTSFGTYYCDPRVTTTCAPFVADTSRPFDSYGSLGGYAPVSPNAPFIDAATIPEPSTAALAAAGAAVLGGAARRRRRA